MSISNSNFNALIFCTELKTHCDVLILAIEKLRRCAKERITLYQCVNVPKATTPIDICLLCAACLSAAAAISKILFVGGRSGKKHAVTAKRCNVLMSLLDNPSLPVMSSLIIRNDWEHFDERLDEALPSDAYNSVSPIHVAPNQPDSDTLVLRRFSPSSMEIKFRTASIALEPLMTEAQELDTQLTSALNKLQTGQYKIYD